MSKDTVTKIQATITKIIEEQYKANHDMEAAVSYAGRWAAGRMKHVAPQERQAWRHAVASCNVNMRLKRKMMEPISA